MKLKKITFVYATIKDYILFFFLIMVYDDYNHQSNLRNEIKIQGIS